ncbi:MAG: pyrroline-5-carboxylate reductase [Pseudobutyrivibrio sp.]|nr:pyrroline-5-carboxylate reductase [Pseudobutyrivibrio sp.]
MNIGFIGCGNMGSAILTGILSQHLFNEDEICCSAKTQASLDNIKEKFGVKTSLDNRAVAQESDIVFLAIKPQFLSDVIDEIKDLDLSKKLIISIVAGQSIEKLTSMFGQNLKIARVMPNTPAMVQEAMSAISFSNNVGPEDETITMDIFSSLGKAEIIPERLQDAVVGVSGSSPAYVYMFIEALADGAVAEGMPRAMAYKFAAQSVLGSAKMVLETGKHPGELKDAVCSPAGTTIEAVATLEAMGFRNAVIEAERVCTEKSRKL